MGLGKFFILNAVINLVNLNSTKMERIKLEKVFCFRAVFLTGLKSIVTGAVILKGKAGE